MSELQEKFYRQIETELEFCDPSQTPTVCRQLSDPQAKAALIQTIAQTSIDMGLNISQAIAEVERQFSIGSIE